MLTDDELESFVADGYVAVRGAVPKEVVAACRAAINDSLGAAGVNVEDPSTWTRPVVRIACPFGSAFVAAGASASLVSAYDQLLGPTRRAPIVGVGGTIPARFPHPDDPGDAGWHVDGSYLGPDGVYWINGRSRGRGLLCLFLFSDVGTDDAPTEVKVGSHLDVPAVLEPAGEAGLSFLDVAAGLPASTFARASAFVTGAAGDVFVCHPFLVHRATWPHRGTTPRLMAQPGILVPDGFPLDGESPGPVELAILRGYDQRPS